MVWLMSLLVYLFCLVALGLTKNFFGAEVSTMKQKAIEAGQTVDFSD